MPTIMLALKGRRAMLDSVFGFGGTEEAPPAEPEKLAPPTPDKVKGVLRLLAG